MKGYNLKKIKEFKFFERYESAGIDLSLSFIKKLPELNNSDAAFAIEKWVKNNYKVLNIDDHTINNYILSSNFEMQVIGIRDYLNKIK